MFAQGDLERTLHLSVSPLMCRESTNISSSQSGFLDFIVLPLYQSARPFFDTGAMDGVISVATENRRYWKDVFPHALRSGANDLRADHGLLDQGRL